MPSRFRAFTCAPLPLAIALPALAQEAPVRRGQDDVLVVAQHRPSTLDDTPASTSSIDAAAIATRVNALSIEDALKYLPSLIVRKRNPGDTQAPLATRTSGLGASARSLIYADGALLSALIGNNNGTASPRWSLLAPQEVERIDVLYGPFAAAYPGNSIGAVVNITTRLPERLEASANVASNVQTFSLYGDDRVLPTRQVGATLGDRIGPFSFFASYDRVDGLAQPLLYVTAPRPAATGTAGIPAIGGLAALSRTGAAAVVVGANGIPQQVQDRSKLKLALDLGSTQLRYVGGLFLNAMRAGVESYIGDAATGQAVYAGTYNLDGRSYTLAASAFSGGYYTLDERHWSHSLSATGGSGGVDWQVIGTLYDYAHDVQRMPTGALPAAADGGPGTITRMDGTGWQTLDARLSWAAGATMALSGGAHLDRFVLKSDRFATSDWIGGDAGALTLQSRGKTRTTAVWAQDVWRIVPALTLTIGGRYEWWRAYDGVNYSAAPSIAATQPARTAARFSPKATLAWAMAANWTARLSAGEAWRFPTVGELYQIVTTPVAAVPNPDLRPEHARSEELALEQRDGRGGMRLALFHEVVSDALLSQTGPLNGTTTLATFVQNVDRTRARGVELSADRRDVVPRIDLSGSVTWADATTRADAAFPAAVGRILPQVPRWKATLVGTWRPIDGVSLTAAGRYASRMYGTLDNSDVVGNTYQGFYKYLVVDLRAQVQAGRHLAVGFGIDNLGNDRYFLFHPFPQRSFQVDLRWTL